MEDANPQNLDPLGIKKIKEPELLRIRSEAACVKAVRGNGFRFVRLGELRGLS
jgi:hypothetical protein